jgi:hypothetical protein
MEFMQQNNGKPVNTKMEGALLVDISIEVVTPNLRAFRVM